jgi:hypothetical protein
VVLLSSGKHLPVSHSAQAQQLHKGSEDGNGREKEKNGGYDGSGEEEGEFSNIDAKGLGQSETGHGGISTRRRH